MSYFHTCPRCGTHLDPGEVCDCQDNNVKFNHLLNSCRHPNAVYHALLALGNAGLLGREKAPVSAANADRGKAEQGLPDAVSASIMNETEEKVK